MRVPFYHWNNILSSLFLLVSRALWFLFPAHIKIYSQGKKKKTSCHLYMLRNKTAAAAAAKSLQSYPTLCDPIDGSPLGSLVPGILQAKTLEWVAISFSNAWKWKVKVKSLSHVRLLATPWTAAFQAPHPWDFPGKSTGVGCHCLLQWIKLEFLKYLWQRAHWRPVLS